MGRIGGGGDMDLILSDNYGTSSAYVTRVTRRLFHNDNDDRTAERTD